jgi:hypothetical protein
MYDFVASTTAMGFGDISGPVHFHNAGILFEVFFGDSFGPDPCLILQDGVPIPIVVEAGEANFECAIGFDTSPNSAVPHNMFEFEVLFTGGATGMPNGHSHGAYSPDPSHWGADLQRDPPQSPAPQKPEECTIQLEQTNCDPIEPAPEGLPIPCPRFPPEFPQTGLRFSFGEATSNACVDVDTNGDVTITPISLPGEFDPVFPCPVPGDDDDDVRVITIGDDDDDDDD